MGVCDWRGLDADGRFGGGGNLWRMWICCVLCCVRRGAVRYLKEGRRMR